jgi:hypothetical protein
MPLQNYGKQILLDAFKIKATRLKITGRIFNSSNVPQGNITDANVDGDYITLEYLNETGSPNYRLKALADGTNIVDRQFTITPPGTNYIRIEGIEVFNPNNMSEGAYIDADFTSAFTFPTTGTFTLTEFILTLS